MQRNSLQFYWVIFLIFLFVTIFLPFYKVIAAEQESTIVYVANTQGNSVSVVDISAMKEIKQFKVGLEPYGIALSKDGKTVAVGVEGEGKVKFFDTTGYKLKGEVSIDKMFHDHIILTQDGKHLLVADYFSDDVIALDIEKMEEAFRIKSCDASHVIKYGPLKKLAYVTCKKITGIAILDIEGNKLLKFHQINVNPRSLTFSPDESKLYFGSFWVDGIFEMESETGKVTRLFALKPPDNDNSPKEVTYHGVELVYPNIVLAANEGRSCVDAIDVNSGKHLDRLTTDVSKPCCIEQIPSKKQELVRVLVSNTKDGTVQVVEVSKQGKLKSLGKVKVGEVPKRVALFVQDK